MPRVSFKTERPFIIGAMVVYALIWKLHYDYYTPRTPSLYIVYLT